MNTPLMALDIKEAMDANDVTALKTLAESILPDGKVFVEVGSWKGHSASVIASLFNGTNARLWCVDHWQGNEGTRLIQKAKDNNIYDIFEFNLQELGLWSYITPLKMDSLSGSKEFAGGSIDFLFIDADHRYLPFLADLQAWYPRMRQGSIICGHDCESKYSQADPALQERIEKGLTKDFDGIYHCGVVKGLHDYFHDDYEIFSGSRIWHRRVE